MCVCAHAIFYIFLITWFIQKRKKRKEKKETSQNEYLDLKLKLNRFTFTILLQDPLAKKQKILFALILLFLQFTRFPTEVWEILLTPAFEQIQECAEIKGRHNKPACRAENGPNAFFADITLLTNNFHLASSFLLCCCIFSLKCLAIHIYRNSVNTTVKKNPISCFLLFQKTKTKKFKYLKLIFPKLRSVNKKFYRV